MLQQVHTGGPYSKYSSGPECTMARVLAICGTILVLACVAAAQVEVAHSAFPAGIEDVATQAGGKGVALTVMYAGNNEDIKITTKSSGIEVSQADAAAAPNVIFKGAERESFYTLFMVDPDAPNGQGAAGNTNFLHWLVSNIPGSKLGTNPKDTFVNTVAEYQGPSPPDGTHRYVFMLYEQTGFETAPAPVVEADRQGFDFNAYAAAANMRGPVGAVYFVTSAQG